MKPFRFQAANLFAVSTTVRTYAATRAAEVRQVLGVVKRAGLTLATRGRKAVRRRLARAERRVTLIEFGIQRYLRRHVRAAVVAVLVILIVTSAMLAPALQSAVSTYFDAEHFSVLRNLLSTSGGALVGATAIGFSVVMIAVQLNFARMPHGLFRKLSSDVQLLGAFSATFLLAIGVSALALVPDATWSAVALIAAGWATLLILVLFLYGYRRALALINPTVQLGLIVTEAQKDLRRWARPARLVAPLLDVSKDDDTPAHDLPRLAFFQANPQWTWGARQAVTNAVSFARRYAEQGDYEVARSALTSVTFINALYVTAKGKTFFAHNPIFDLPQASDGFINETLEQLRQFAQAATARGEEEPLRQILATMAALVQTYMAIDYATHSAKAKDHAQLAAGYLASAVEAVLRRGMPDVVMEGVRLMGKSAQLFLAFGQPNCIVTPAEKISGLACAGAMNPEFRAVTLTGMEQLACLTFDLLRTPANDIGFAVKQVRGDVELVVRMFLNVPDTPLSNEHSTYLAPYYSLAKTQTLGTSLTDLCNAVIAAEKGNKNAEMALRHLESWAEELYRTEKALLLLAIEKKSQLTFDLLHWIAHVTKLLTAVAQAPASDDQTQEEIERHASWLISVISWIPEDKVTTAFVENFSTTELLFEAAIDALIRNSEFVAESARSVLIGWTFKAGRHASGWGTLKEGLLALATLVLWKDELQLVTWLTAEIIKRLGQEDAPDSEMRDRTARSLRRMAVPLRHPEFELNPIRRAMGQLEPIKLRTLLKEIADLLSPSTAAEQVRPDF